MGKLNLILLGLVVFSAIQVIDAQHEARTYFVKLGQAQQAERQLEVAYTRLQLEQTSLAKAERVDQIAREKLGMRPPEPKSVVFMPFSGGF